MKFIYNSLVTPEMLNRIEKNRKKNQQKNNLYRWV